MQEPIKTNPIRLSVVDSLPIISCGIKHIIKRSKNLIISFVNQYSNGNELAENLETLNSDVVLIDCCLPDIKGYKLARLIYEKYPTVKIGIFSSNLEPEHILNSIKSGVLGYLPKSAAPDEVVDFILTISHGEKYFRGIVADLIFENEFYSEKNQSISITKREQEILQLIMQGFKNKEIAEKLSIADRTVEFHKQNIYSKLEVNNTIDLYKAALRNNLISKNEAI